MKRLRTLVVERLAGRPAAWIGAAAFAALVAGGGTRVQGRAAGQDRPRDIEVVARRFEFVPSQIEVTEGDHVRLTIRTEDGTHGFEIKKLGLRRQVRKGAEPVVVEFDAPKAGTYEIKCSEYCGRGHSRMKGTLVVDAATERARQ